MGQFLHQGGNSGCPGVRFASVQGTGSFVAALPIRAANRISEKTWGANFIGV
jgi:hypothetical protein